MASEVLRYTYYPSYVQLRQVAERLVAKYPCLRDPTESATGCESWIYSLQNKMSEVRAKLRKFGNEEMQVSLDEFFLLGKYNYQMRKKFS